jgi:hypothetical protein
MYPLGEGVIALATSGVLPLWPRFVYAGLELATLVACLLLYVRICRRQPGTGPVLALIPVAFAWRSLFTYFVALPMLSLWVFLATLSADRGEPQSRDARSALPPDRAYARRPHGAAGQDDPGQVRTARPGVGRDGADTREQVERPAAA